MWADRQRGHLYDAEQNKSSVRVLEIAGATEAARLLSARDDTQKLFHEREIFLRAQQLDLKRAARDLTGLQTRSLDALRDDIVHRENRYLALFVEPLDTTAARNAIGEDPSSILARLTNNGGPDPQCISDDVPWPVTQSWPQRTKSSLNLKRAAVRAGKSPYSQSLRLRH